MVLREKGVQFLDSPHFQSCVVTQKARHCKQLERSPSESAGPTLSLLCPRYAVQRTLMNGVCGGSGGGEGKRP